MTLHRHHRYTHTHVLTHSNINSRLFAAHAEMHASANVVTHNTVDAKETPLGASASTTTWQSVLPYGDYGFAGQLGKGKLAGGAVTILAVRLNHQLVATTGRLECGVCLCATSSSSCGDFHRHTGRRRLLVLLASRVPEEVVSRTCVPFLPQASVQYHTDFPTRKSLLESDRGILSGKSND